MEPRFETYFRFDFPPTISLTENNNSKQALRAGAICMGYNKIYFKVRSASRIISTKNFGRKILEAW